MQFGKTKIVYLNDIWKKLTGYFYDLGHFPFLYKVMSWTHKHMNLFDYTAVQSACS